MTRIHNVTEHLKRAKYKCDICGKIDFWGDGWLRYSSMSHDEECPDDVPTACSEKCHEEIKEKIKCREFVLPRLDDSDGYYSVVTKQRKGY